MTELTQDELAALIQAHRDDLHRFLSRRLDCADTAADLVQELFLRLAQGGLRYPLRNPRAFLFRVAANLATDHLRRCRSLAAHSSDETTAAEVPG